MIFSTRGTEPFLPTSGHQALPEAQQVAGKLQECADDFVNSRPIPDHADRTSPGHHVERSEGLIRHDGDHDDHEDSP
jgi:hypothetical protein